MSSPSTVRRDAGQPGTGFEQFSLTPSIQRGIAGLGFTIPRPIQAQTVPAALAGRDVLGLAQTGTGKTAAFALPILERFNTRRRRGARALIVAPTRELAMQIQAEIVSLARFTGIKTVAVFGGVSASLQIRTLRRRPEIIIACPGRLLDLMQQGEVDLGGIEVLVLDEADHMFDMGFLPDIRRILQALPAQRQNLFFAATMPAELRKLTRDVLQNPCTVELAHSKPAETIEHALYPVGEGRKIGLLRHLLSGADFTSAIVFARTKYRAKRLAEQLCRSGHRAVALQGNMSQPQRDRAMSGFRQGRFDILVATDIAARGIDVANVSHVINFDVPSTPDAYTHRIGRTGRAERSGKAFTLVCDEDRGAVRDIERTLGEPIVRRRVPGFDVPRRSPVSTVASARERSATKPGTGQTPRERRHRGRAAAGRVDRHRHRTQPGRHGAGMEAGNGNTADHRRDYGGAGAGPRRRPRRRRAHARH
jgi:ATP-dependent RNA helicase RhlE